MKWLACLLAMSALSMGVAAQEPAQGPAKPVDLTSISIEDLMNIQVTSASKKAESLSAAPAAIFVITGKISAAGDSPRFRMRCARCRDCTLSSRVPMFGW
ncbi:MAG: hypothetical protein WCA19_06715 [Candidatus Acidiferrales bacterium]